MSCCVASCSYTLLNWKLNSSASFFGFGMETTGFEDSDFEDAAETITSFSNSLLRSGRIRATTRTLIFECNEM